MPHDVFISHSSRDKPAADAVCAALEARGIACWIAPRDVRPGKLYGAEIVQAINGSKVMVLLHSQASNDSSQVTKEVERADAAGVVIVSVRIETCRISDGLAYFLSSVQWIDATRPPLESHLGPLGDAVHALLLERGPRPPEVVTPLASPRVLDQVGEPKSAPLPAPSASRSRTVALIAAAAFTVALVAAAGAWFAARRAPPPTPAPSPSRKGVPITGYPPPKTNSPEAAAAYASALQNFRDASVGLAYKDLQRALALDPSFAAANLQSSFRWGRASRGAFAAASQSRASLDERDTALLSFAEAYTANPPELNEAIARIRSVVDRYPDDAEAVFLLGLTLEQANHVDEARTSFLHALDLDPHYAEALHVLAGTYLWEDRDLDRALATFQRCLALSPMAASCLRTVAAIHDWRGQCSEAEADARRMVSIEPDGPNAYWWMARALAARGAPIEGVRAALDKAAALGGPSITTLPPQPLADVQIALLQGDLGKAELAANELDRAIGGSMSETDHGRVTQLLMSIAEERGDKEHELALAEDFQKRMPAWTPDDAGGVRLWRLYLLHEAGSLPDKSFLEQREQLRSEVLATGSQTLSKVQEDALQVELYAQHAETPGEVADGLKHFSSTNRPALDGLDALPLGRLYFLAGQVDAAIPLLRMAANSCSILPDSQTGAEANTIAFLRANLFLGQALEQHGDTAGACASYAKVVARWPHATPRSVTADTANAAMKKLGCEK